MSTDAIDAEVDRQVEIMRAGTVDFHGEAELRERLAVRLREQRPLRVKLGLDPSAPDIHLGHTVVLDKLRVFQELGHVPIFLVGDFTARIGDPSGRKKTRPALSADQIQQNAATYVEQAGRILDVERAEIRYNGEWMEAMKPGDFVRLCSRYTVARLLERDDFHKRYAAGEPIAVHEFLYPFVQAYDSVALEADVELGGTDQTFNLLMAREIQRDYGQPPQAVLTHPLLVGTDGREKMSKSLGNHVGICEPPDELYGKVMSVSDDLMDDWYRLLRVEAPAGDPGPMERKQHLARALVERFQGPEVARAAAEQFRRVVQQKEKPDDVPEVEIVGARGGTGLLVLVVQAGLAGSNSEARRLVEQGAVRVDGSAVGDPTARFGEGVYVLQVGKRRWARARVVVEP